MTDLTFGFLITPPTLIFNLYLAGVFILFYLLYLRGTEAFNSKPIPAELEEVSMTTIWFIAFVICLLWPVWMVAGLVLNVIQFFTAPEK